MESNSIDTDSLMFTVGGNYILQNLYDPDQLWFDFMQGAHFKSFPPDPALLPHIVPKVSKKPNRDTSYLAFKKIYETPEQAVLSFRELKSISNKQFDKLKAAYYPTFDRNRDGKIHIIEVNSEEPKAVVKEWCLTNFKRRFHLGGSGNQMRLILEDDMDAMMAKMRFF